jgi:hypothetical protein
MGATSKWDFFSRFPNGSPKIESLVVSRLWMFISSSNDAFFEHATAISYILQKYLSNGVLHALIKDDLTFALRGFVVGS